MTIEILLVDDHAVVREGLKSLLNSEADMSVVGEAGDGTSAVELAKMLVPDVVVLAFAIAGTNGIEIAHRIAAEVPGVKILALSMHTENRLIGDMLSAGAMGYVHKGCSFAELARAIRTVAAGRPYLCAVAAHAITEGYTHDSSHDGPVALRAISDREREVLRLLAEGKTPKRIAAVLGISVKTVYTHRRRMMVKLGAKNAVHLMKCAIRQGLTAVEA